MSVVDVAVETGHCALQMRVDEVTFFVDFVALRCGYSSPLVGGTLPVNADVMASLPNLERAQYEIELLLESERPSQRALREAAEVHESLVKLILVLQGS